VTGYIGILGAIVLRAILILVGPWLLQHFHWLPYVSGALPLLTGIKMWWAAGQEPDLGRNPVLKWINRKMRISPTYDGEKFCTVRDGVRVATPLLVVIVTIGVVDVIFAVDSIPAIFAITLDPFIVLTSNVFAILGFIGTKMLLIDVYRIPVGWSLGATAGILVVTMVLSLVIPPRAEAGRPGTSSLAGAPAAMLRTKERVEDEFVKKMP
jgi:tellurite resistance protein TerC